MLPPRRFTRADIEAAKKVAQDELIKFEDLEVRMALQKDKKLNQTPLTLPKNPEKALRELEVREREGDQKTKRLITHHIMGLFYLSVLVNLGITVWYFWLRAHNQGSVTIQDYQTAMIGSGLTNIALTIIQYYFRGGKDKSSKGQKSPRGPKSLV